LEYNLQTSQKTAYFPDSEALHSLAAFLQNELKLWQKLIFTVGFRSDYQWRFTKLKNSAHGSLVILLHPKYSIRASVSNAFNTPSYSDFFYDIQGITDFLPGIDVDLMGNRNLGAENILYAEVGNTITPKPWLKLSADLFYYNLKDMIVSQVDFTSPTTADVTAINQGAVQTVGGEIGVEAEVYKGVNLYANWAYLQMWPSNNNVISADNLGNPFNKVNAGIRYKSNFGLLASLDFHWVQAHEAQAGVLPNTATAAVVDVDDVFLLNMKLAYQPIEDHLEIWAIANNILNDKTAQVPPLDPLLNKRLAERQHFRVLGGISYTF
jgi:outer membrane receptor for ferrienterochelin and colicin